MNYISNNAKVRVVIDSIKSIGSNPSVNNIIDARDVVFIDPNRSFDYTCPQLNSVSPSSALLYEANGSITENILSIYNAVITNSEILQDATGGLKLAIDFAEDSDNENASLQIRHLAKVNFGTLDDALADNNVGPYNHRHPQFNFVTTLGSTDVETLEIRLPAGFN